MSLFASAVSPKGVVLHGAVEGRAWEVLTEPALAFLADLHRRFDDRRLALLQARRDRQARFDAGELPDFLEETASVREGDWRIAPVPADILDRRVEITGPVDRKMIINALNSGARVFMADFEDATTPTWSNLVEGQINLKDRWEKGRLHHVDPQSGKAYVLGPDPAVLMVRPRGWALPEKHLTVDGREISGALFDFGLYAFHCARAALEAGSGPYYYLPKLENHHEARLWAQVIAHVEHTLRLPAGSIRVTVLIETLPAAFEMDEILFELKENIVGLNCGRWDYIFSYIKRLGKFPDRLTPDRSRMVMGEAFLKAYSELLIRTCHRRGAFAMGGMAAQIPVRGDPEANAAAFAKVRADKEREANAGHDGTWVAHPDLAPIALEVFDRVMTGPNQLERLREDVHHGRDALLAIHEGSRTEAGLRENIRVGVLYIESWLRGRGAAPLFHLMEDAATAEICRTQIWQWLKHAAVLEDGRSVDRSLVEILFEDEMRALRATPGLARLDDAEALFLNLVFAEDCPEFLTLAAYDLID